MGRVLDPDETETAQRGMYVVYLFAADRTKLYLSLNQGSDDLRKSQPVAGLGGAALSVPRQLRAQAKAIRSRLELGRQPDLLDQIDLRAHLENISACPISACPLADRTRVKRGHERPQPPGVDPGILSCR
jgi:MrcB-like, N-terminal domain